MLNGPTYSQAAAITPGSGATVASPINDLPVRGVLITATVAGNVVVVLAGGQTVTVAVAVGSVILQLAALGVNTSGTTATATYWALA